MISSLIWYNHGKQFWIWGKVNKHFLVMQLKKEQGTHSYAL